ncbi:hypothetical protein [Defluviicoccus vanus]|uniref:Uncharacterized protein n=1 Tax=Defluviicoccus vanus TaxID=111831 RepID=A0A7H1N145_9PROT|nr:hypothetical protein [Defluviicoccus vanus]QNT69431.1 hypothetical protein HQ394_08970 [Defluviicoccus vanus]
MAGAPVGGKEAGRQGAPLGEGPDRQALPSPNLGDYAIPAAGRGGGCRWRPKMDAELRTRRRAPCLGRAIVTTVFAVAFAGQVPEP